MIIYTNLSGVTNSQNKMDCTFNFKIKNDCIECCVTSLQPKPDKFDKSEDHRLQKCQLWLIKNLTYLSFNTKKLAFYY